MDFDEEIIIKEKNDFFAKRSTRSRHGLYLEQSSTRASPSRYRIYNALLFQYIEIPCPQKPSLCIALDFVFSVQAVKLLSVHEDHHQSLGYEILSVGFAGNTYRWRPVEVQNINECRNRKRDRIQVFFGKGSVAYCISWDNVDIGVDVFDMENESYIGHTNFPKGNFFPKLSTTNLLDWNGQLSFAEIVKDELHVLVLEDHKKLKWAETKRIIRQLPFDNINYKDTVVCAHKSILFFVRKNKEKEENYLCTYDIHTRELISELLYISEDEVNSLITFQLAGPTFQR